MISFNNKDYILLNVKFENKILYNGDNIKGYLEIINNYNKENFKIKNIKLKFIGQETVLF